jgi:lipoyl(octanoyl) transferase
MVSEQEVEWRVSPGLTDYETAFAEMNARAEAVRAGTAGELVWLLQHPPLFTAGTSADPAELFNPQGFPVHAAGRGGRYTYHGPASGSATSSSISTSAGATCAASSTRWKAG